MNYFDWFDVPVAFFLDEKDLKKKYIQKSRALHPDFFTQETEDVQTNALEQSTYNNQAYKTLKNADSRMQYILDLKGALKEEGQNKLPQSFLMEMMDINEAIMELEFDYDEKTFKNVKIEIENLESTLYHQVESILSTYNEKQSSPAELNEVKNYYLKRKYILRIKENLNKFAAA